jgi:pimeloyl-ACP methyl ester carboxylesterase
MKIIVQNLAMEYRDDGSGKVLLFLHGWQDSLQNFNTLSSLLAPKYRIICLDLPGFGKSEMPKEAWNLDRYIDFVSDFIKKLNLEVYALVGHSFGGRIIIKGEAENIFTAQKIILIGSAGITKRKTFRNYFFKIVAKVGKLVVYIPPLYFWKEALRKKMYSFVGTDYANAGALQNTFLKIISEDLTDSAKKITVPSLLIWGENDTETPLSDGQRFNRLINNSQLEVLKAGHFVHKEKSQEVAELIQKFL